MSLSPGYIYLARLLPHFLLPSVLVYACLTIAQHHFDTSIPSWITAILSLTTRPVLFFGQQRYRRWLHEKAAAAHGAILLPRVLESPSVIVNKAVESTKNGYPGGIFAEWAKEYGHTYQLDLLTNSIMLTTEPEHIKVTI